MQNHLIDFFVPNYFCVFFNLNAVCILSYSVCLLVVYVVEFSRTWPVVWQLSRHPAAQRPGSGGQLPTGGSPATRQRGVQPAHGSNAVHTKT